MGTCKGLLDAARSMLGLKEQPLGSNNVEGITDWFGWGPTAWCAEYVAKCAEISGNADVIPRSARVIEIAEWFQDRDRFVFGVDAVQAGDLLIMDWGGSRVIRNADHIAIATGPLGSGGVPTIGGNEADRVREWHRPVGVIVGYCRPAYGDGTGEHAAPVSDGILRRDSTGDAVRALQQLLSGPPYHLQVDGEYGPATEAAVMDIQRRAHIVIDGEYGPATEAALAAMLAGQPNAPVEQLKVDGERGPLTVKALQRALNAHGECLEVDGVLGRLTIKALQAWVGARQDGVLGPLTVKALQLRLGGLKVDGEWGPLTTEALQTALNEGRV